MITDTPNKEDELDELFNKTINAKKIAVNTVIRTQDVAYNDEVLEASKALLERYREEFKATIESHTTSQLKAQLDRLEKESVSFYERDGSYVPLSYIRKEREQL